MPKLHLLLVDAVVVIHLHELGLWEPLLKLCDVHLSRGIVAEAHFYTDADGVSHTIDLNKYEAGKQIVVHEVSLAETEPLRKQFGQDILEKLDPGEAELLAILYNNSFDEYKICSADKIVFRVLGALRLSEQGVSLEEVFRTVGITHAVGQAYSKKYREQYSRKGFEEGITGLSSL